MFHVRLDPRRSRQLAVGAGLVLVLCGLIGLVTCLSPVAAQAGPGDGWQAPPLDEVHSSLTVSDPAWYTVTAGRAAGEMAYIPLTSSDRVVVLDLVSHFFAVVDVGEAGCDSPRRAAMSPDGASVYVSCYYSHNVAVIDTASHSVVAMVPWVPYAEGITFIRDGDYALVGSSSTAQLVVVDTASYLMRFIPTPDEPRSVVAHPFLDLAYATCGNGTLLVVDTNSFAVVDTVDVGSQPGDVAITPDGQWLFVSHSYYYYGNGLTVIDPNTLTVHTTLTELDDLNGLAMSRDGAKIYASGRYDGVHVIDRASLTYVTTIPNSSYASRAAVTCDDGQLLSVNNSDRIAIFALDTYSMTDQLWMPGAGPADVAVCPQYFARGVELIPPNEAQAGGRGEVVAYEQQLINVTDAGDSFDLALGYHTWDAALSTDVVGPLANGESATFTVYVTVPLGVAWYSTDTVRVHATSVASPTVYSDTAALTTQAYAPPQVSVAPESLTSSQYVGEIVSQSLTIANGNGVTLTFEIDDAAVWPYQGLAGPRGCIPAARVVATDPPRPDREAAPALPEAPPGADTACLLAEGTASGVVLRAGHYYSTTIDNEDNYYSGSPDGDMDAYVYGGDWNEPIEFNILVDAGVGASGNRLIVQAYDVDSGETDEVWLNGVYLGDLVGYDDYWSRTVFDVPPGLATSGANLVEIRLDYDWGISVDWGSLYLGSGPAPWLDETPDSGLVPSDSSQEITVAFDATRQQPGQYRAEIRIQNDDPARSLIGVPVTMTVLPTTRMGWVEGVVADAASGEPLAATLVAAGQPFTVTTEPESGYYKFWLDADDYSLQVSAEDYLSTTVQVSIVAQQGISRDIDLLLDAPQIAVWPAGLAVSQWVGQVTTEIMTVTNHGPGVLAFEISAGKLEHALDRLNAGYEAVTAIIPERYDFSGGESGYSISDGGGDMYDGGNYLSTDRGGSIYYSDNTIVDSAYFGDAGRYFTRKYPGLFVLAADLDGVDYFRISGNLGADGAGEVDGTVLQLDVHGTTYYGFVKRVYNAGDPSVNHLIIVPDAAGVTHTFPTSTDSDFHEVNYLSGSRRLYYLLFAGNSGAYIDDSAMRSIMATFLETLGPSLPAPWLSTAPASATVPAQDSLVVQVTFDAGFVRAGRHTSAIVIESNDPITPSWFLPVEMEVRPRLFLPLLLKTGNE